MGTLIAQALGFQLLMIGIRIIGKRVDTYTGV